VGWGFKGLGVVERTKEKSKLAPEVDDAIRRDKEEDCK